MIRRCRQECRHAAIKLNQGGLTRLSHFLRYINMTKYKIDDDQGRLAALSDRTDPSVLADELGLARWLAESAANKGNAGLANSLLATLARLSAAHTAAQIKGNELLGRDAVLDFAKKVITAVSEEVEALPALSDDQKHDFTVAVVGRLKAAIAKPEVTP
jgi:hypothetical protein